MSLTFIISKGFDMITRDGSFGYDYKHGNLFTNQIKII